MVRAPAAVPSRAASSAAGSVARDIVKKRDKPYKTEKHRVLAKKRKLNLTTSYTNAPDGYTFLPVGTPDLADLCKKLSKERDLPVSVVNTRPTHRMATDPTKLSHHVHRIGYHFQSDVLEEAVAELNYTMYKGRFVKESDLAKQRQESLTAQIMIKHGFKPNESSNAESHDQVRAAIKELFPKIPHDDLEGIVDHAWKEGSGRVGSVETLDLPRRVQLAVIARIRHQYTDYDRLLRAFEWREARQMTEPVCLQKLIEWRGEQDAEDDGQLEEMVRETIVIDDDDGPDGDEVRANGSEADDEESAAEQGDHSDASIEIISHNAYDTDIGGESAYEAPPAQRRGRAPPAQRQSKRQQSAREKIFAARERIRNDALHPMRNVETFPAPHQPHGGSFEVGGIRYDPVPPTANVPRLPQVSSATGTPDFARLPSGVRPQQGSPIGDVTYHPNMRNQYHAQDRPVASIERHDGSQRPPQDVAHHRPATPDAGQTSKRRRIDHGVPFNGPGYNRSTNLDNGIVDLTTPEQPRHRRVQSAHGEVIDLMTPEPHYQPVHPSPLRREVRATVPSDVVMRDVHPQYQQSHHAPYHLREMSPMRVEQMQYAPAVNNYSNEQNDLAYDPSRPMLQLPHRVDHLSIRPEQSRPSSFHSMPRAWPAPRNEPPSLPQHAQTYYEVPQQPVYAQHVQQVPVYGQPPPPPGCIAYDYGEPSRPTPQPVHGAPAPVQVMPRHAPHQGYGRPPTVPPPQPPTDGAPAPVQVIPRHHPHNGFG